MLKKIFLFLSISFIIFFWSLYYFHIKEKKAKTYLEEIWKIQSQLEKEKLYQIKKNEQKQQKVGIDKEKILEQIVAKQLSDVDEILNSNANSKSPYNIIYQKLYLLAMKKNNIYMAIKAITKLLPYTNNKEIWLATLVDLNLQVWQFKDAEKYCKDLIKISPTKQNLKKYLYVLIQTTNFFDKEKVKKVKEIISLLYEKQIITSSKKNFYFFLVDILSNWDIKYIKDKISEIIKTVDEQTYKDLLINIQKDINTYENSKWSPKYYFKALVALDLLKFWYFWLAKNIASQVYIEDDNYILPIQILAYSYFYMWNYNKSNEYFQKLKMQDKSPNNEYNFFIWVSYYMLWKYTKALLYLSQTPISNIYWIDVLRYKLLSYIQIDDKKHIIASIENLLQKKLNYVDYYNIFKYLLFKCKKCYKDNIKLIIKLVKKCYIDLDKEHQYVCWYWKWNLFLKYKKTAIAVQYFKLLSKYFQDPYIWNTLAKYYEEKHQYKKARYYYLKELLFTSDEDKRKEIKEKIKNIFLKK